MGLRNLSQITLPNMWLLRFLLCVIDIYSKYTGVALLNDKKGVTITNAFRKLWKNLIVNQTNYG